MSAVGKTLRILLVDDHPVVLKGIRSMLSENPELEIVGEAYSGEEALEKLTQLEPDIVLTDILMPGMNGIEITRRVKRARPETIVILLTMYDSNVYVMEGLRAGAAGYLVKNSSPEFLRHAIETAVKGGSIVKTDLLHHAVKRLTRFADGTETEQPDAMETGRFTVRELEVLRLVAEGYANRDIAKELSLAEITVKKYVQSVISKLGASDRTQAAIKANQLGLVQ